MMLTSRVLWASKRFSKSRFVSALSFTEQTLVDSFTDKAFGGNPAGVVFATHRSELWMQNIATENNLPVTAFVASNIDGSSNLYDIRWFTPSKEIALCGHATLAAAHVIYKSNKSISAQIWLKSKFSGVLGATRCIDGNIQLDFPSTPAAPIELSKLEMSQLCTAFGIEETDIIFCGRSESDVVLEIKRSAFARIPQILDFRAIADIEARGVVVTCLGKRQVGAKSDDYHCVSCGGHSFMNDPAHDYLLRGFYPNIGLNEDFATGSAQCALAPYYYSKLGVPTQRMRLASPIMTCNGTTTDAADAHMSGESHEPAPVPAPAPVFLSGYQASQRGGKMQIAVVDTAGVDEEPCHRVLIKGMCVSVMKSKILV